MSTPINTLPLKTQQTNIDANDINDPIVQDVLNEFQEELHSSKQTNKAPMQMPSQQMQLLQQQQMQQMQQQQQQQQQQLLLQQQQMQGGMQGGLLPVSKNNSNKFDNMSSYLDIEVAKKSLILVIISLIIYNSGIINTMYEKMPEYLQDNLNNFDIYIKSASLFTIIYILSFFEYL
jgi:small-conductance mechanosensitive channel